MYLRVQPCTRSLVPTPHTCLTGTCSVIAVADILHILSSFLLAFEIRGLKPSPPLLREADDFPFFPPLNKNISKAPQNHQGQDSPVSEMMRTRRNGSQAKIQSINYLFMQTNYPEFTLDTCQALYLMIAEEEKQWIGINWEGSSLVRHASCEKLEIPRNRHEGIFVWLMDLVDRGGGGLWVMGSWLGSRPRLRGSWKACWRAALFWWIGKAQLPMLKPGCEQANIVGFYTDLRETVTSGVKRQSIGTLFWNPIKKTNMHYIHFWSLRWSGWDGHSKLWTLTHPVTKRRWMIRTTVFYRFIHYLLSFYTLAWLPSAGKKLSF